jgi:Family of unknown function (DUF5996)
MPQLKDTDHATLDLEAWPSLPFEDWKDTCATLHMWTQIVGKIRLAQAPMANHWWQVALYVTSRGLTTSAMPHGTRFFTIDFDFIDHRLRIEASDGTRDSFALVPCTVADFHQELRGRLRPLGLDVGIWTTPVEIPDPIPFEQDRTHKSYDRDYAHRFWCVLAQSQRVFERFRSRFIGKVSPVNFYWGSFDLAITRFSGRVAPPHPGAPNIADSVTREAYSHEVSSLGFWPGNGGFGRPAYYSYAYPEPAGFGDAPARPADAFYSRELREFILPYDSVRRSATPDDDLLAFAQSAYEAAADRGRWDRAALERTSRG